MKGFPVIVVFGSINADLVTLVDRHPMPGETVAGSNYQTLPGGKGANQALAARRSGAVVHMVGSVGADGFAEAALKNLKDSGVDLSEVEQGKSNTGVALIAVSKQGENTIVVIPGANAETEAEQLSSLNLGPEDILITQNELDLKQVLKAHTLAKKAGVQVVHNAAPAAPISADDLKKIDYLIVNETEALLIAASMGFEGKDPIQAARHLQKISKRNLVITLGENGAVGLHNDGEIIATAIKLDVVDTTGAGDSFVGAFAAALDEGAKFEAALNRAVAAGSLACRSLGAQSSTPELSEITAVLSSR